MLFLICFWTARAKTRAFKTATEDASSLIDYRIPTFHSPEDTKLIIDHLQSHNLSFAISDSLPCKRVIVGHCSGGDFEVALEEASGINLEVIVGLFILAVSILVIFVNRVWHHEIGVRPRSFWILRPDAEINEIEGDEVSEPERLYLQRSLARAKTQGGTCSGVTRLVRQRETVTFRRVAAIEMDDGRVVVFAWLETPPHDGPTGLDVSLECENEYVRAKDVPTVEFSLPETFWSYTLRFTLEHNVKGLIRLPMQASGALQPYGQFLTGTSRLLAEITKIVSKNQFLRTNFENAVKMLCEQFKASRAFCFNDEGNMVFMHVADGVESLPEEVVQRLPERLEMRSDSYYVKNLLTEGKTCFVACYRCYGFSLRFILEFTEIPTSNMLKTMGSPIMTMCCVFVHQLSYIQEQNLRFKHFMDIMAKSRYFAYFEFAAEDPSKLTFESSSGSSMGSSHAFIERGIYRTDQDYEKVVEARRYVVENQGKVRQLVLPTNAPGFKWISMSLIATEDVIIRKTIVSVIVEEISKIKQQESELKTTVADVDFAMKALGCHKFINNSQLMLETDELPKQLGYDNVRSLKEIVYPADAPKLQLLATSHRASLRLVTKDGKPVWFTGMANRHAGFLFSINDLVDVRANADPVPLTNSKLVIWTVNPENEMVEPIFGTPTIWDVLGVDKDCEFSRFVNFIHQDHRSKFIGPYSCLLKGTLQYWSDNVKVMKFGGEYEWHRLSMARNEMNRLYCISVRIHDDVCKFEKSKAQLARRDKLLKYSRVMLWTFEDNSEECEHICFAPGVDSVLAMNWTFVERYIRDEEKAEMVDKMQTTLRSGRLFEMLVTLKYENSADAHVILQGKVNAQLGRVVGTAIEVNYLWDRQKTAMETMAHLESKKEEKQMEEAKRAYEARCLFNNIFGIIDVLHAKSTTKEQGNSLTVIDTLSHNLMEIFLNPLIREYREDNKKMEERTFNILDTVETVMHYGLLHALSLGQEMDAIVRGFFPEAVCGPESEVRIVLTSFVSYISTIATKVSYSIEWHGTYLTIYATFNSKTVQFDEYSAMMKKFGGMSAMSEHVSEQLIEDMRNQNYNQSIGRRGSVTVSPAPLHTGGHLQPSASDSAARGNLSWKQIAQMAKKSSADEEPDPRFPLSPTRRGSVQDRVAQKDKSHWFTFSTANGSFSLALPLMITACPSRLPEFRVAYRVPDPSLKSQIETEVQALSMEACVLGKISQEALESVDIVIVDEHDSELEDIRKCIQSIFNKPVLLIVRDPHEGEIHDDVGEESLIRPVIAGQLRAAANRHKHMTTSSHYKSIVHIDRIERRVLVVEDDPTNQFVMRKILEALGCTFAVAENGEEALRILDEQDFDIVFMDYRLPVLDGIATTKIMRNSPKAYASIPIVGISGDIEAEEECLRAGMNVFFPKPVRIHHVKDALTSYYG